MVKCTVISVLCVTATKVTTVIIAHRLVHYERVNGYTVICAVVRYDRLLRSIAVCQANICSFNQAHSLFLSSHEVEVILTLQWQLALVIFNKANTSSNGPKQKHTMNHQWPLEQWSVPVTIPSQQIGRWQEEVCVFHSFTSYYLASLKLFFN